MHTQVIEPVVSIAVRELPSVSPRRNFPDVLDRLLLKHHLPSSEVEFLRRVGEGSAARPVTIAHAIFQLIETERGQRLLEDTADNFGFPRRLSAPLSLGIPPERGLLPIRCAKGVSALCSLTPHELFRFFTATTAEPHLVPRHAQSITLGSFNVCGLPLPRVREPQRFEEIGALLTNGDVEVWTLQEMWSAASRRTFSHLQGRFYFRLADGTPRQAFRLFGKSGLITLSRHPITDSRFVPFTHTYGVERTVRKGVLWTRIAHPAGLIDVFNVHLISPPESLNRWMTREDRIDRVRVRQVRDLRRVMDQVRTAGVPQFISGDCNAAEGSLAHLSLTRGDLVDLYRARHPAGCGRAGFTFDTELNRLAALCGEEYRARLDYIVGRGLPEHLCVDAYSPDLPRPLSDHYPLIVRMEFTS